jgi:hypothetical protein
MYPFPSSFEIPFAPQLQYETKEQVVDPIINGSIYYKFPLSNNYDFGSFEGTFGDGTDLVTFFLDPNQTPYYSYIKDFFKGYYITIAPLYDTELTIRSFDPSSGKVTLNIPWQDLTNLPAPGIKYYMYTNIPSKYYVNIPTIDINGNTVLNYELAYNGYFLIFESYNTNYSNKYNSNIFFRKISYYDYITQNAYFEEPLKFSYDDTQNPIINFFTLRKTLPLERWTVQTPTYINSVTPENPSIGPQIGPVITLPEGASNIDNFYKGKYVYNYSENAYNPPEYPLESSIPDVFYPIYGCYYIKSYNSNTRELSISQEINSINSCIDKKMLIEFPSTKTLNIQFLPENDFYYISETSQGTFRAFFNTPSSLSLFGKLLFTPYKWKNGQKYTIKWNVKKSSNIILSSFKLFGILEQYVVNDILNYYQLFNFDITTNPFYDEDIGFEVASFISVGDGPYYIEWDYFEMIEYDTINICDFSKDNFSPLDYNGSVTSQENTSCYNISLSSLTLPNISLLYGSKISFYPYVYVVISNTTSPSKASEDLIYSNNPHSDKAIFIAPVGLQVNPNTGTFLSLYSNMTQTIKFKPNDNLKFEVYLPDGSLFKTLLNDSYTPYEPDQRVQIEAVFSISINSMSSM